MLLQLENLIMRIYSTWKIGKSNESSAKIKIIWLEILERVEKGTLKDWRKNLKIKAIPTKILKDWKGIKS